MAAGGLALLGCLPSAAQTPTLTVNGVSADYTTTRVFLDETRGESQPLQIALSFAGVEVTNAQVYSNLNRRDRAALDADGDGAPDGIRPPSGDLVGTNDAHYYRAYPMQATAPGVFQVDLAAQKTGAYRLTARWQQAGVSGWVYYSSGGRRDHAVVVSPRSAREMVMYELNAMSVEASGTLSEQRSTFADLHDAPGAVHANRWNLDYVRNLGANWLWFQPIHPPGIAGRQTDPDTGQPFEVGSPYAVKNFFEVAPLLGRGNTRAAALAEFTNFVAAADAVGVRVMLDAPFNHTAYDAELAALGASLFAPGASAAEEIRNREARFFARSGDYCARASSAANIAVAPDRGDFGKFADTYEVFFGRYAALVCQNPADNLNYLSEADWFDTSEATGHFDVITRNVWQYFAAYVPFWLDQTGCPTGTPSGESFKGIDGLRCDFAQGLPPQAWEYIVNVAKSRKWDFIFMAESLDGGPVTRRSARHFDVLNENILFALKSAGSAADYRAIYEQRRADYGLAPVLLNTTSHDEENYSDPWQALVRYAANALHDGVPMIFQGQELGISTTYGFDRYELNFGKQIPHFKKFNSMAPIWNNSDYGLDQLYPVYAALNRARLASPALRGPNRYYLNQQGGGIHPTILAAAKYEQAGASPAANDVVLAFVNLDRNSAPVGTFQLGVTQGGSNLFGLKPGRLYQVKNLAAYTALDSARNQQFLWGTAKTGADLIANGLYVALNRVPQSNGEWGSAPYEAQFLKLLDVTPPPAPERPAADKAYALSNRVEFFWPAVSDGEGGAITYLLTVGTSAGAGDVLATNVGGVTRFAVGGVPGQTLYAVVRAVNAAGIQGPASPASAGVRLLAGDADDDADGALNWQEDIAGTDPLDPQSVLRVRQLSGGGRELQWPSVAGRVYAVWAATDLSAPFIQISPPLPATAETTAFTDTNAALARRFYRLAVQP